MTEYEQLSLTLLANIASGMSLQVAQSQSHAGEHAQLVLQWKEQLDEVLEIVRDSISNA